MALQTKIKHIDKRPNGVLRFRRRFPKDVAEALGEGFLQVHIRNTEGLAFHREYQEVMAEFDRMVRQTREELQRHGNDHRTTQQKWHDALITRAGLTSNVVGLDPDDPETGRMIFETMRTKPDPMLTKALLDPEAPAPKVTLMDAFKLYRQDKRIEEGSKQGVDLSRVSARVEAALGDPDKVALEDMTVDHRRRYLDHMLNAKKADGTTIALGSAKRETNIVVAVVNHALKEMDIAAMNRFADLPWPKEQKLAVDKKLPLPDDLVSSIEARLSENLRPLWVLLRGTGMRLGEAVGLVTDDIVLDGETPHVLIRPNSIRTVKTASSVRSVPLVGEALRAVREALEGAPLGFPIFPRYGRPRGADAASAALMKVVRDVTPDTRFTVHGLRHRVSDKLRDAGAPVEVRYGFLGHANQAVAETTYGSPKARLKEFQKWAVKAAL
ncbi:tyrosine-type recombinase/integrase [uncultured Jannaschia sp.]|uniref:tyrosine-type recombinase/integrase n=1 Tax=uncultured Jannaschia sp. TaxID=293347 RepID=UPI00262784DD|nr:tyrosine-type recombinase/integrase [uncultured Jannaschia sp.]